MKIKHWILIALSAAVLGVKAETKTVSIGATFTLEQYQAFADFHGWKETVSLGVDGNGAELTGPNPVSYVDFAVEKAQSNMIEFLAGPAVDQVVKAKDAEKLQGVSQVKQAVQGALTVEVQ